MTTTRHPQAPSALRRTCPICGTWITRRDRVRSAIAETNDLCGLCHDDIARGDIDQAEATRPGWNL